MIVTSYNEIVKNKPCKGGLKHLNMIYDSYFSGTDYIQDKEKYFRVFPFRHHLIGRGNNREYSIWLTRCFLSCEEIGGVALVPYRSLRFLSFRLLEIGVRNLSRKRDRQWGTGVLGKAEKWCLGKCDFKEANDYITKWRKYRKLFGVDDTICDAIHSILWEEARIAPYTAFSKLSAIEPFLRGNSCSRDVFIHHVDDCLNDFLSQAGDYSNLEPSPPIIF